MKGFIDGLAAWFGELRKKSGFGAVALAVSGGAAVLVLALLILALSGAFPGSGGRSSPVRILGAAVRDQNLLVRMTHSLDAGNISYELRDGTMLYAPDAGTALRARSLLIRDDLLPTGTDPWAIFDMERWTATDFERNVNLRRAVTAAVKRHIESIDDIEKADVAIVMPEKELFSEDQNPVTASVVLQTKTGSDFARNPAKIAGVRRILCFAVEGLSAGNVVITDSEGLILDDATDTPALGHLEKTAARQKLVREMESRYRAQVLKTLQQIYTADRVRDLAVRIAAEPQPATGAGQGKNPLRLDEESAPLIGRLSVSVNIDGIWKTSYDAKGKPLVNPRGGIEREYSPIPAAELSQAEELIRDAVGFNRSRGDSLTVRNIPFDRSAQFSAEDAAYFARASSDRLYRSGFMAALALAFVLFVLLVVSLTRSRLAGQFSGTGKVPMGGISAESGRRDARRDSGEDAMLERRRASLQEEAAELARKDPAEAARLIRSWIREEGER
jgi:flagellar biosynthesis/type III secretory pathway M-ring protein FliF/YscJ